MLSIVIPTYKRTTSLLRTVRSLLDQEVDVDVEIVVVDTAMSRETSQAVEGLATARRSKTLRYIAEPQLGLLAGRHRGVRASQGELLAFVDDDIEAAAGWAAAVVSAFEDPGVDLVGGPCDPLYEAPPPEWTEELWVDVPGGRACVWLSLIDLGRIPVDVDPNLIWGLNLSIRRTTLVELGGFHPDLYPKHLQRYTGDGETGLTRKLARAGHRARYSPEARVKHQVGRGRMTLDYLQARGFYGGYARSFTESRHRGGPVPSTEYRLTLSRVINRIWTNLRGSPGDRLKTLLLQSEVEGFKSHQRWLREDAAIRAWNQREDYWDYSLADGTSDSARDEQHAPGV